MGKINQAVEMSINGKLSLCCCAQMFEGSISYVSCAVVLGFLELVYSYTICSSDGSSFLEMVKSGMHGLTNRTRADLRQLLLRIDSG